MAITYSDSNSRLTYSDLDDDQQDVVDNAIEMLGNYSSLELEELDAREAVKYDNFRRELEGTEIERGDMSDDDLEGYLKAGILTRNEEDNLEINAVWQSGHIEKLEENNMYDFEFNDLYAAKDEDSGVEKLVYGNEDGYRSCAEHGGSLKFRFEDSIESELEGDSNSNQKIEEMIADFIYELEDEEEVGSREEYVENFDLDRFREDDSVALTFAEDEFDEEQNDTTSFSKSSKNQQDQGGDKMTDDLPDTTGGPSDDFRQHLDRVKELSNAYMEIYENSQEGLEEGKEVLEKLQRETEAALSEYDSMRDTVIAANSEIDDLYETLDRFGSMYVDDLERVRDQSEELRSSVEELRDYSDNILDTLEDREYPEEDMAEINSKLGEAGDMLDALDEAEERRDW